MEQTITEKILTNDSQTKKRHKHLSAGDFTVADIDIVMAHDSTAPLAIEVVNQIGKRIFDPRKIVIVFDHFFPQNKEPLHFHQNQVMSLAM